MRDRELNLVVMVVFDESGLTGERGDALEKAVAPMNPDFIEFTSERTARVIFKLWSGAAGRADAFADRLTSLLKREPGLKTARVGKSEGLCACRTDTWGRVRDVHLGAVVFEAMRSAVS